MNDDDRDGTLESEDRLPWLEAVESDDEDEGLSASKLLGFLLAALIALGVVLGGVWWLRSQSEGPNGDGSLIAAAEGDYKVKPGDPGGMKVEGQGDASFAASEGEEANGKVDMAAKTETPVAASRAPTVPAAKPVAAGAGSVTAPVANGTAMAPAAPTAAPIPAGSTMIQLGAFGSQVGADQTWASLSRKVPGLSGLQKSVAAAAVGGSTVYRLRANAGNQANGEALCAKVKATGSVCMVVR